jgi:hypothetical protein
LLVARLSAELRAPSRIYDNMIEISGLRRAIVAAGPDREQDLSRDPVTKTIAFHIPANPAPSFELGRSASWLPLGAGKISAQRSRR